MKNFYITLSAYIFFIIIILFAVPRSYTEPLDARAVWNPPYQAIQELNQDCSSKVGNILYVSCVTSVMEKFGSSQEAINFTRSVDGRGFLVALEEFGRVAVAQVMLLGSEYSETFYLVNSQGNRINIDDTSTLDTLPLEKNKTFQELKKTQNKATLYPGTHQFPQVDDLAGGKGQRFIFYYPIKDGCKACKTLGVAQVGFDFSNTGRFNGVKLLNISH